MPRDFLQKYLHARAITGPWRLEGEERRDFAGAVVIPALAEEDHLFSTLETLGAQPAELRSRFLVVVVVNHRADAPPHVREENRRTLLRLARGETPRGLPLAWVDAATEGREFPPGQGVGLARKIGCDLALARLDWSGNSPLLVFLDADTLVDGMYLQALVRHFQAARAGGAVLPFSHLPGINRAQHEAIVLYELFLRGYVLGLSLARSPYAFHTVGSTIACRAAAYVRAGGMNRRLAGEDFYFLQQLAKTAGVAPLSGTLVRPSARPSERTPFGTGRSVARQCAGEAAVSFYHPGIFTFLGQWIGTAEERAGAGESDLIGTAEAIHPEVRRFLDAEGLPAAWEKLRRNFGSAEGRRRAFHGWFDGLRTLRLIHHLSVTGFARCGADQGIGPLLQWTGRADPGENGKRLDLLRQLQNRPGLKNEGRIDVCLNRLIRVG